MTEVKADAVLTQIIDAKCWLYLPIDSYQYPAKTQRFNRFGEKIQQYGYVKGIEKDNSDYHYWFNAGTVVFNSASSLAVAAATVVVSALAF